MAYTIYRNGHNESPAYQPNIAGSSIYRNEMLLGRDVLTYRVVFANGFYAVRIQVGGLVVRSDVVEWELPE